MRLSYLAYLCLLTVPAIIPAGPPLLADEAPAKAANEAAPALAPPTAKDMADTRMAFMKAALSHFTVRVGNRPEASRAADPCLRWTDPVSGSTDGIVAVYAHNGGRPDAVAQFFINSQKRGGIQLTIIPDGGVTLLRSDRHWWTPSE